MKIYFTSLLLIASVIVNAQSGITWSPAVDISTSNFSNQHPRIATDGLGNPVVIWGKFTTKEVYFSKWDGTAFTTPVVLNPSSMPVFTASWAGPDLAAHGDTIYVVFKPTPEDTNHIFIVNSYDGGNNFSSPVQVDALTDSLSRFPAVTTDSAGNPVVAFMRFGQSFLNAGYYVCRSNDYGNTFNRETAASMYQGENVCDCCPASIVTSGNTAAMLYRNNNNDFRTIWCGVSNDNSNSFPFGMEVDLTSWNIAACPSTGPDGIIIGDSVYSVFMSGDDARCYFSSASLSTYMPGNTNLLTDSIMGLSSQNYPRIANSGNKTGIILRQNIMGTGQLAFFYTEDIASGISHIYDTLANGSVINSDLTITDQAVFVVWQDDNSETVKYRKGTFSTAGVSTVENKNVLVYPNPVDAMFNVSSDGLKASDLMLFDVSGRNVQAKFSSSNGMVQCTVSQLAPGIYFLKSTEKDGSGYYRMIIKK